MPARLIAWTGTGYTWQGVEDAPGGTVVDLVGVDDNGGADKAFEWNGDTSLPAGTIVLMERGPATFEYRFQKQTCSA